MMKQNATRSAASVFSIFEYWKDKCITEDGDVCIEGAYPYERSVAVIGDWGEPECFACGRFLLDEDYYQGGQYDLDMETDDWARHVWSSKRLRRAERAHIIPYACGGTGGADNLFLLCPACHQESPDTAFADEFFRWVYRRRRQPTGILREVSTAFDELKAEGVDICLGDMELSGELASRVFSKVSTHGAVLQAQTMVAAIKHYIRVALSSDDDLTSQTLDHIGSESGNLIVWAGLNALKLGHLSQKKRYKTISVRAEKPLHVCKSQ